MADIVRALDSETGQVINLDLTPQWSPPGTRGKEQQAVTEGNAKYIGDTRVKGKPCSEIPPGFAAPKGWQGCSHGFFAPHLVWPEQPKPPDAPKPIPSNPFCGRIGCTKDDDHKHGKGRPKGAKNKQPKTPSVEPWQGKHNCGDDSVLRAAIAAGCTEEQLAKIKAAIDRGSFKQEKTND